jgi:hypothetical protein
MLASAALAHDPKAQPAARPTPAPAPAGSAAAAVEGFHAALAAGDRKDALGWLAPEVVIFESGGAEMSRNEYASHHLDADIEFVRAVETEVVDRQEHSTREAAWVLTRTHTAGRFRERDVDVDGVETMVLRRADVGWRVVHVHWSSQPRRGG